MLIPSFRITNERLSDDGVFSCAVMIQPLSYPSSSVLTMNLEVSVKDPKIQFLTFDEMMKAGIMPWDDSHHDMNKLLAELSPEEAKKMKRKFRKLWRKELKRRMKANTAWNGTPDLKKSADKRQLRAFGQPNEKPSKMQLFARREAVAIKFKEKAKERVKEIDAEAKVITPLVGCPCGCGAATQEHCWKDSEWDDEWLEGNAG